MANDPNLSPATDALTNYLQEAVKRHFEPYVKQITESLKRSMGLVQEAKKLDEPLSAEVLRAVVVLNHAHFEDFLRTLAVAFLPIAGEKALEGVPLASTGRTDRAEKFHLGKLFQHRGKTVDDLLIESVAAHMERSTFNSVSEIIGFLENIGLKLPRPGDVRPPWVFPLEIDVLTLLDAMIRRRHHIVHRADKGDKSDELKSISQGEVLSWMIATESFMLCVATSAFAKTHSYDEIKKKLREMEAVAKKHS